VVGNHYISTADIEILQKRDLVHTFESAARLLAKKITTFQVTLCFYYFFGAKRIKSSPIAAGPKEMSLLGRHHLGIKFNVFGQGPD